MKIFNNTFRVTHDSEVNSLSLEYSKPLDVRDLQKYFLNYYVLVFIEFRVYFQEIFTISVFSFQNIGFPNDIKLLF